ncbi:MAG: hypothetical protein PHT85_06615, partial [Methylovulum sp.]|nr:hypothetical protein [Methylovulum sp.]
MTEFEIINFNEKDNPVIKERLRHSIKITKSRKNTGQCCFKLFGWVIDKKQRPVNIVVVAQGIKVFHELNVIQNAAALRMSEKLGTTINERCGFSFKLEATEDFDLYLEVDHSLIPWKKVKIITTPVAAEADQQTELALQQFKNSNFLLSQTWLINEIKARQNQLNDSISLATEALFYFFSNQYKEISSKHVDAVNRLVSEVVTIWSEAKKISYLEAINGAIFEGNIVQLIEECKSENFAVSLVEGGVANNLNLASPFSTDRASCQESYEVDGDFNCLRFTDDRHCFFLMQGLTSADGLYFPGENVFISFAVVNETHVQNLKKKLLADFANIISYAKADNGFFGILASHNRPYHFYYDIWPVLFELSEKPEVVANLPNVVMR